MIAPLRKNHRHNCDGIVPAPAEGRFGAPGVGWVPLAATPPDGVGLSTSCCGGAGCGVAVGLGVDVGLGVEVGFGVDVGLGVEVGFGVDVS